MTLAPVIIAGVTARERTLDAVEKLIADGGLRAVSIASVASAAGVSRQTVYTLFGTREELIAESITQMSGRVLADIIERLEVKDALDAF